MYRKYTFPSKILNYLQVFAPISVSIKLNLVSGFFNSNLLQHHPTIYCWRRPIFNPDLTIISEQSPEKSEQVDVIEMEAGKCTEFYLLYPKPHGKRKKKKRREGTHQLLFHYTTTLQGPSERQWRTWERPDCTRATEEGLIELMKGAQAKGTRHSHKAPASSLLQVLSLSEYMLFSALPVSREPKSSTQI